jgi:hypothetical protein
MPYCRKCGAQLKEDAKFCHVCGTPVAAVVPPPTARSITKRTRFPLAAIILIAIIAVAAILALFLIFLPLQPVNIREYREAPFTAGVNTLDLNLSANVANVNIVFENLPNKLVTLNTSMTGGAGIFYAPAMLQVTFGNSVSGNVLTVVSTVNTPFGWLRPLFLNITCDLRIDTSLASSLNIRTSLGKIVLLSKSGVTINFLSLESTTGDVNAELPENSIVGGNVSLRAVTGGVDLTWHNVMVTNNIFVTARTTTGGISVDVMQNDSLQGDVAVNTEATTGGIDFAIDMRGNVGAKIQSSVTTGTISVARQIRFTGDKSPLQSENYPATHNFSATLKTTTGRITLDARYT